jgi:hypothetical protein
MGQIERELALLGELLGAPAGRGEAEGEPHA